RALRVYADRTNLSVTPGLWPQIRDALAASDHFILLASPEAARSYWVDKEVAYWLEHKGPDTLYLVVTGGEGAWAPGAGGRRDRRRDGGAAGRGRAAQPAAGRPAGAGRHLTAARRGSHRAAGHQPEPGQAWRTRPPTPWRRPPPCWTSWGYPVRYG